LDGAGPNAKVKKAKILREKLVMAGMSESSLGKDWTEAAEDKAW